MNEALQVFLTMLAMSIGLGIPVCLLMLFIDWLSNR